MKVFDENIPGFSPYNGFPGLHVTEIFYSMVILSMDDFTNAMCLTSS